MKPLLSEQEYRNAADRLKVDVATIRAVAEVESRGEGFLSDGTPKILFERHIFSRLTNRKYDQSHPDISNRKPGGYGPVSKQHERLQKAVALDRDAALQSASYGRFQIMGFNWQALKYASLQEFINAMYRSEADHLDAFLRFIEVNGLAGALRSKNWAGFARRFNGPNFRINSYDTKLANAYKRYSK